MYVELPVALFAMLHKVVLNFDSLHELIKCATQALATEQYFLQFVAFILLRIKPLSVTIKMEFTQQDF